ncbi:MAG: hypothetical protein KAS59_04630 [Alphaproteobacteria bacterium]|nr:hypothetical protein [Alphaproteobacteria bacterium]MCK5556536.1 hypothetical protein [Alphaproteobacteria bacterium]
MNWYKMYHGAPLDTKLAVIAKRAGLRRGEMLALWVTLLDYASQSAPRGSVRNIDLEEIAVTLEFDPATIESALKALHDKKRISADGFLIGWDKCQALSTPRTRAFRARQKEKKKDDGDSKEVVAERRERLRNEMLVRHKKRGRTIAERPSPSECL